MDNRPIGVFDSGIGGLTAVKELIRLLPNEDFVYFGDTARVPYGSHRKETIIEYAKQDLNFLLEKNVKAVLIACGTVSSTSIDELKKLTSVPIVGVISAAAEKAANTGMNTIVFATNATINSHAYLNAIKIYNPNAVVHEKACPLLVPLIENGYTDTNNPVTNLVVEDYTSQYVNKKIDTVILGCTHYPIIADIIQKRFPNATLVEAGKEAALKLMHILQKKNMCAEINKVGKRDYYVSEDTNSFKKVCKTYLGERIDSSIKLIKF